MVGEQSPASSWKRFRFLVFRVSASNSRRLIVEQSETDMFMSPVSGKSRNSWWAIEDLAGFESVARTAEADKSWKI